MKLSRAASYAIEALVHLAGTAPGTITASHRAAEARGIPDRYLLKALKPLVGARILYSVKGPNGGFRLTRPAKEVTLLEIVEAVDGPIRGEVPDVDGEDAALHRKLEGVCKATATAIRERFGSVTLQELAGKARKR